jgi:hypothetical protein
LSGRLWNSTPTLLYFKPRYKYLGVENEWYSGMDTSKSQWNGKTVKLARFTGALEDYAKHLDRLSDSLWVVGYQVGHESGDFCGWQLFPRMILALDAQAAEFRRAGISYGSVASRLRSNDSHLQAAGCDPLEEVLKP